MFNLFRLCQKYEISFDIVSKNGNNATATFDFVEKNRSTCSIRQCCVDIVDGVDGGFWSTKPIFTNVTRRWVIYKCFHRTPIYTLITRSEHLSYSAS